MQNIALTWIRHEGFESGKDFCQAEASDLKKTLATLAESEATRVVTDQVKNGKILKNIKEERCQNKEFLAKFLLSSLSFPSFRPK